MGWLTFDGLNWLAIAVAFLVSFAFGWFWYSDAGIFKLWRRLGNISDEDMKGASMGVAFGGTIIGNLVGVIVLAMLMAATDAMSAGAGLVMGAVLGLAFRAGAHFIHNGFALRHPMISVLDSFHDIVGLALAGLVIGLMG